MKMLKKLDADSHVEDILITLTDQTHIMHIISAHPELCLYIALDAKKSNIALSRTKVKEMGEELSKKYKAKIQNDV